MLSMKHIFQKGDSFILICILVYFLGAKWFNRLLLTYECQLLLNFLKTWFFLPSTSNRCLSVSLPLPLTLTTYLSWLLSTTTVPVLSHLLASLPALLWFWTPSDPLGEEGAAWCAVTTSHPWTACGAWRAPSSQHNSPTPQQVWTVLGG